MKRTFLTGLALATLIASGTASAEYDLEDNYIGGSDPRDVIGSDAIFNTLGLNASITGSILNVDIYTNFAGYGDNGLYSGITNTEASGWGNGIGYGDLFLSSAGSIGEWEYGFSLDNRWSETGGSGSLYLLNGPNFLYSDDFISTSGGYRTGHEVAVDTSAADVEMVGYGSWSVDKNNGVISFAIQMEDTGLPYDNGFTFGWGMTCANDVIQGTVEMDNSVDVPEPGALGLVGIGLIGTLVGRRRRKAV